MEEELTHHGILGMHWGVRRTPEELGHTPKGDKRNNSKGGESGKTPGQTKKKVSQMSDEELRTRLNRMNMEEQYNNIVARRQAANTSTAKRLIRGALEDLGRKSLGLAVDAVIEKMRGKDEFDINDYKDMDVYKMDAKTIAQVSKWYENAGKTQAWRKKLE